MQNFQNLILSFFVSLFSAIALGLFEPHITLLALIGFGIFIFCLFQFYIKLGSDIPLKELIMIIAFLQWIVGPILSYHFYTRSEFYYMIIDENTYMSYTLPASAAFFLGIFAPVFRRKYDDEDVKIEEISLGEQKRYRKKGGFLFTAGALSILIANITSIPAALKFVFALFSSLSFVGAFYLYRSDINFKWIWLGAAFIPTMLSAAQSTTFHEMFLWGGFIIIIYTYVNKSKPLVKFGLVSASIAVVLLISSVKAQFREQVSEGNITDKAGSTMVLVETINEEVNDDNKKPIPEEEDFMQTFVDRINQGWIIARVMYVVPEYEPFAKGETIEDGIYAALLPRILAPNKQVAGGATNFERFTGLKLVNTSMNLSIVGEAYGNYGEQGGIIFMFIYGFFFNAILHIIRTKAITTQEYLLWIPFMFLYTVKAEDDFGMSLNYFTKSAIVMVLFVWLSNRYMKVLTAG